MDEAARAWMQAARRDGVQRDLDAIYALVARETAIQRPACAASGRCCNFARSGHLLYVTGLEAACTLLRSAYQRGESASPASGHAISLAQVERARTRGDCPFLVGASCGVHAIKPLGCRVYFCDPAAQRWQQDLSERAMAMLRELHEHHEIPYAYAEWRGLLARLVEP